MPARVHRNGNLIGEKQMGAKMATLTPTAEKTNRPKTMFSVTKAPLAPRDESVDMTMTAIYNFQSLEDTMDHLCESGRAEGEDFASLERSVDMTMTQMIPVSLGDDSYEPETPAERSMTRSPDGEDDCLDMSMTRMIFPAADSSICHSAEGLEVSFPLEDTTYRGAAEVTHTLDMSMTRMVPDDDDDETGLNTSHDNDEELSCELNQAEEKKTELSVVEASIFEDSCTQDMNFTAIDEAASNATIVITPAAFSQLPQAQACRAQVRAMADEMRGFRVPVLFPDQPIKQRLLEKCLLTPLITHVRAQTKRLRASLKEMASKMEEAGALELRASPADGGQLVAQMAEQYQQQFRAAMEESLQAWSQAELSHEQSVFLRRDLSNLQSHASRVEECKRELTGDLEQFHAHSNAHSQLRTPDCSTPAPSSSSSSAAATTAPMTAPSVLGARMDGLAKLGDLYEQYQALHRWRIQSADSEALRIVFPSAIRDYTLEISVAKMGARVSSSEARGDSQWWDLLFSQDAIDLAVSQWSGQQGEQHAPALSTLIHTISSAIMQAERSLKACDRHSEGGVLHDDLF